MNPIKMGKNTAYFIAHKKTRIQINFMKNSKSFTNQKIMSSPTSFFRRILILIN